MALARLQTEYQQLTTHIQQRSKEFELTDYQFQQVYWPIRDTSLQIMKVSESHLSRKLVFYSWRLNRGVIVRRVLIPQGYPVTALPTLNKVATTTTNPALLYQSQIEAVPAIPTIEDDNEFLNIIRMMTEVKVALAKWKLLSHNPDLMIQPLEQIVIENELLTIVQQKGYCSLEDLIQERTRMKSQFSLNQIAHVTYQIAKFLTLFEFKRDFHLNFSASNLILANKPSGDLLDIRVNDFGVRMLYLRLYFEMQGRYSKSSEESARVLRSKSEMALQQLYEKDLLNKALVNELIKHKVSEDLEETLKSLMLFYDRLTAVITILRVIRMIPGEDFNKVVESWFETPSQRAIIDLRFVQMRLTQLLNANANFFHKLLVPNENPESQRQFQLFLQSLKILLGPPDFVIADQLNRENAKKNDPKKVSVKNIRVAYQTLMFFHDNADHFPFIEEKRQTSTVSYLQQAATIATKQQTQQKVLQPVEEIQYYLYFTNKFAGAQAVLEKTEFNEIKRMFSHLYKKQSFNTYEQYVFDVQNDDDMSALLKYMKQDQGPKPVKVLIQRQSNPRKLVMFRMNACTLAYLQGNKHQRKAVLAFPVQIYGEFDVYNSQDTALWLSLIRETSRPLHMKFNNIHKIGEQIGLRFSTALMGFATLSKLDLRFVESMVTDRWLVETLACILWGLPLLVDLGLLVSSNNFPRRTGDPDWEAKFEQLLGPYSGGGQSAAQLDALQLHLPENQISDALLSIIVTTIKPSIGALKHLSLNLSGNDLSDACTKDLLVGGLKTLRLKLNSMPALTYLAVMQLNFGSPQVLEIEVQGIKLGQKGLSALMGTLNTEVKRQQCHSSDEEYEEEYEEKVEEEVEVQEELPPVPDTIEMSLDDDESIQSVSFKRRDEATPPPTRKQIVEHLVQKVRVRTRRVQRCIEITEKLSIEQLTLNLAQVELNHGLLQKCGLGDEGLDRMMQGIRECQQLTLLHLNLEKNALTHVGTNRMFVHMEQLATLQSITLNLKTNCIGETGMEKFARLRCADYLKHLALNLYNNQMGTKGAAVLGLAISHLPTLHEIYLDLGMNCINDGFYILLGTMISTSPVLERFTLDMTLNPLDKEPPSEKVEWSLRNLAAKSRVQSVQLVLTQVAGLREEFILITSAVLGCLTNLKQLSLNYNKAGVNEARPLKGLESVSLCITELQQLVEINLHLQKTRVTDQEIDILGIQIVRLQQLQKLHLNLQENDIRNAMPNLATRLSQLQSLIYLKIDLSRNLHLDLECCHQFVDGLAPTRTLECLDMQMRELSITDDQIIQLGRVLKKVETLLVLNLDFSKNLLKERGANIMGSSLNQMERLRALTLDLGLRQNQVIYDASPQYRELMTKLVFYRFI